LPTLGIILFRFFYPGAVIKIIYILLNQFVVIEGRSIFNYAKFDYIKLLGNYLLKKCCVEHQKEMMMVEHGVLEVDRINKETMKMDMGNGPMTHDDPNSVLLEPGKQSEIIWKFKDKIALEIACNVPSHYDAGVVSKVKFN